MSKGRTLLSRPRTKVYDSNYNIGQSYYKSAIDGLDRKYSGRSASTEAASNGGLAALRASLDREREKQQEAREAPRPSIRDLDEDDFFSELPKRRGNTASLLGEFDSIFDSRHKNGVPAREATPPSRSLKAYNDEVDDDISESMKRLKAARARRAAAEEADEYESKSSSKSSSARSKLNFSNQLIESVGLTSKARSALEEEAVTGKRRVLKITASSTTEGSDAEGGLTKWTAISSGSGRKHVLDAEEDSTTSQLAAASRARQSRARLEDIEAEMQALTDRCAARDKRVRDLKALVQENETSSKENLHTTMRVKSSITSEKKMVSF